MATREEAIDELPEAARAVAERIGAARVIAAPLDVDAAARDMGEPPAMLRRLLAAQQPTFAVRPAGIDELAAAVAELAVAGVAYTPRGLGSTGLGGALPVAGGAVLDLSGLSGVRALEPEQARAELLAGSTFYALSVALERSGLELAARPSNAFGTLGGWAAAGGLGLGSLRAGALRERVEAIELVRPDGARERLRPGDAGFDETFDTEGQLGVLASMQLRLDRIGPPPRVAAYALADPEALAAAAAERLAAEHPPVEMLWFGRLGDQPELADADAPAESELLLIAAAEAGPPPAGAQPLPPALAARLWARRFFPMDHPAGPVFLAAEAVLAPAAVPGFVRRARRLARRYRLPLLVHGHAVRRAGEAGLLLLLLFPCDPTRRSHHLLTTPLAAALTALARRRGGRPYGVGVWNTPFARSALGPERFRRLAARKRQLDPYGLCNPGKFFELGGDAHLLPVVMGRGFYPGLLRLATGVGPALIRRGDPSARPASTAERCIACGACVPVCPAVAATGAESVSGRAKLGLMRRLAAGAVVDDAALLGSQRCLMCGQCAEVCSRGLELVEAWEELEAEVRRRLGQERWRTAVADFAARVDAAAERTLEAALP
jgi:glycolate oxidase